MEVKVRFTGSSLYILSDILAKTGLTQKMLDMLTSVNKITDKKKKAEANIKASNDLLSHISRSVRIVELEINEFISGATNIKDVSKLEVSDYIEVKDAVFGDVKFIEVFTGAIKLARDLMVTKVTSTSSKDEG